jgi:predicted lipid-binding transport protein (Tim44 family)
VRRPSSARSAPVQRRRRIAGGLLAAIATTLVIGLVPTFRVFLVVHLFLVDSFLAYIALLAHTANRAARSAVAGAAVAVPAPSVPSPRRRPRVSPRPAALPGPLALN